MAVIYEPYPGAFGASAAKLEEPGGALRWKGSVLQQEWRITTYHDDGGQSVDFEWRDVPSAPEHAS